MVSLYASLGTVSCHVMTLLTVATVTTVQFTAETVRVLFARCIKKQTRTHKCVYVDKDVENNTSIKKSNIICVKELVINIYQFHYVATIYTHMLCKIIIDI